MDVGGCPGVEVDGVGGGGGFEHQGVGEVVGDAEGGGDVDGVVGHVDGEGRGEVGEGRAVLETHLQGHFIKANLKGAMIYFILTNLGNGGSKDIQTEKMD